jgi:two-component system KDP operon response regulator KdpE
MKALIVEDEPQTIEAVSLIFKLRWPEVELLSTTKGSEAALMVEKESPDIVILDLGLPDVDGIEVLKEIRAFSDVPVIIVTARGDSVSQVKGLELGADDYITKPFDPAVLLARVKNVIAHARTPVNQATAPLTAGNLIIDFANRQVSFQGKPLALTPTEYRLLCHLARNAGRVLSHDNILRAVWGEGYETTDILRACIYQLRQKLIQAGADPGTISAERGIGYKFVIPC